MHLLACPRDSSYPLRTSIQICLNSSQRYRICSRLSELCQSTPLKAIVFTRPNLVFLRHLVPVEMTIQLERNRLDTDIDLYFEEALSVLANDGLIDPVAATDISRQQLVRRAEGMFLWARLMIIYIKSPALTKVKRLAALQEITPTGLQDMYLRILSQVGDSDEPSQRLAAQLFTWIIYGKATFTPAQLKEAILGKSWDNDGQFETTNFELAAVAACRGLIELRTNGRYRLIHQTAISFLQSNSQLAASHVVLKNEPEVNSDLTAACLSYLLDCVPPRPLSGKLYEAANFWSLEREYPFLEYSISHWFKHFADVMLQSTTETDEIRSAQTWVSRFLAEKLTIMVWLESIYLFSLSIVFYHLQTIDEVFKGRTMHWYDPSAQSLSTEFSDFVEDMISLNGAWATALKSNPKEIWGDVTVFSKSRFLEQSKAASVRTLAPRKTIQNKTSAPTFCTSVTSADCSRIGVLGIYPSQ